MNSTPNNFNPLLIRTDFSDDTAWHAIRTSVMAVPSELSAGIEAMQAMNAAAEVDTAGYGQPVAFVNIVDDPENANRPMEEVMELANKNDTCLFLVDAETISNSDHPVLVVDLSGQLGRTFRIVPSEVWSVASNLSIANMDWEDFADNVGPDGVFRGF